MSLSYKVMSAGVPGLFVEAAFKDVTTGLAATGSSQSDALQVTNRYNAFSTVAASTGAILDSQISAGDWQVIYNGGANTLKVYPISGASINAGAANAAYSLAAGIAMVFYCISTTLIITFGTMAGQNSNNVNITGGSITGITDLVVADGGTGVSSFTAYAPIFGGTTSTGALQSAAGLGSSGQVLTSNGAGALATFQTVGTTLGTAAATTSGTSVDITGIPSGSRRLSINLLGVSSNGVSPFLVQLGTSGGIVTSGYNSGAGTRSADTAANTAGFILHVAAVAARAYYGSLVLNMESSANNTWIGGGTLLAETTPTPAFNAGAVSLSGEVTQVRLTTVGGVNTFDLGEYNWASSP